MEPCERAKIKIIVLFCSVPTQRVIENYKKLAKKIKNKEIPLWLHYRPKFVGKCREREKIKIIDPFSSYPTRDRKFKKIIKKIQKFEKYHYGFIPRQNRLDNAEKERK